jgi:GNAT superfamily N-acetyltransferase
VRPRRRSIHHGNTVPKNEELLVNAESPSVQIRRANPDDAGTVLTMLRELAAHQDELGYVQITEDRWRELLGRDDILVLLAECDGRSIGYASVVRRLHLWSGVDLFDLDDLYVREEARNAGIGRLLMLEIAKLALPERLIIRWGVAPAAQRFYERLGAGVRTKTVASWSPEVYDELLSSPEIVTAPRSPSD